MERNVSIFLKSGQTIGLSLDKDTAKDLIWMVDEALLGDKKTGSVSFGTPLAVTIRLEDIAGVVWFDNK